MNAGLYGGLRGRGNTQVAVRNTHHHHHHHPQLQHHLQPQQHPHHRHHAHAATAKPPPVAAHSRNPMNEMAANPLFRNRCAAQQDEHVVYAPKKPPPPPPPSCAASSTSCQLQPPPAFGSVAEAGPTKPPPSCSSPPRPRNSSPPSVAARLPHGACRIGVTQQDAVAIKMAAFARPMEEPLITIAPGLTVRLRGAKETYTAVENDFYMPTQCICCTTDICCIMDANYILCPVCKVVSPLEGIAEGYEGGVGLGFTLDDLHEWQYDILARRRRGY